MAAILNLADAVFDPEDDTDRLAPSSYGGRTAALARQVGAKLLGYSLIELPPGKRSCPAHNHRFNEEMFLILEGTGTIRIGDRRLAIKAGDVIACPPGDRGTAHQIDNTSDAPLRYFALSTMIEPDIIDYPDSGKFLVKTRPTVTDEAATGFRFIGRQADSLDYWDGEA